MVNVKNPPFNAKGDGISDDTEALQAAVALAGHQFARRHIFFPAGTYLISEPLVWSSASYFEMLGESEAGATIRLAPRSPAFQNASDPQAVIQVPHSSTSHLQGGDNVAFQTYLRALTISVGPGNPGARGLEFIGSNIAGVFNVSIVDESSVGNRSAGTACQCGLSMQTAWPGPLLVRRVTVRGFQQSVCIGELQYSVTFEHLQLLGFTQAGLVTGGNPVHVRGMRTITANASAPGLLLRSSIGSAVLSNCSMETTGDWTRPPFSSSPQSSVAAQVGPPESPAALFASQVRVTGYASAVSSSPGLIPVPGTIETYSSLGVLNATVLEGPLPPDLPVVETPETPYPTLPGADLADWAIAGPGKGTVQAAMREGKPFVWVAPPNGSFNSSYDWRPFNDTIRIPASVRVAIFNDAPLFVEGTFRGTCKPFVLVEPGAREEDPRCAAAGLRGSALHQAHEAPNRVVPVPVPVPAQHSSFLASSHLASERMEPCAVPPPLLLHSMLIYNNQVDPANHSGLVLNSSRVMVVKHGGGSWDDAPLLDRGTMPGDVMLENVATAGVRMRAGQRLWARQFDTENHHEVPGDLSCDGCSAWILGHKTEGPITVLRGINGARVQVLGSLYYPVDRTNASTPVYQMDESSVLTASFVQTGGYRWLLNVTREGTEDQTVAALPKSASHARGGGSIVSLLVQQPQV